jgi:hypothetical protein
LIKSPSNLEFLLHCFYSSEIHERIHAPAIQEGIKYLLAHDMIVNSDQSNIYRCTEKGDFYIKYLICVPFPRSQWTIDQPQMEIFNER